MKVFRWLSNNILFVITLFLLAFIPLYPKLPLLDIKHTWVYVRVEDFIIGAAAILFLIQLWRKKATLKTPLTIPIAVFWGVGLLSTLAAIFFIFPQLENVFPSIAFLHFFRRIEYLGVFFIAYSAIQNKKQLKYIIAVLAATLVLVCAYGYGQRGFIVGFDNRFPAFSTMNEEFAKGLPLLISAANRIQSTFAGHYDLAAYLVMLIPIMGALVFGIKKWYGKLFFLSAAVMGLILLLMTASRVSFAVYLLTITFMLLIHKQKKFIIPVIIASIILMNQFQGMAQRFASTVQQVDLVVNAKTGEAVGVATNVTDKTGQSKIVVKQDQDTGGDLHTGSTYVPVKQQEEEKTSTLVQIQKRKIVAGKESTEVTNVEGDFVIKKALAYDISFTTRLQGTWPRAIEAFKRNIFLGSGYSSISLASDNNYIRILGEVGLLGIASFVMIFVVIAIYAYRILPDVDSPVAKSFILGVLAGLFGLALNATLIDVFEASKVAFVLWLLVGVTVGLLHQYKKHTIHYLQDIRLLFTSTPLIAVYLFATAIGVFSVMLQNYFVADDFTWLRWVADCNKILFADGIARCESAKTTFISFLTQADGFFYRPGTKILFYFLYAFAWLNPLIYHFVSVFAHYAVGVMVYLISNKLLKSKLFAFITAFVFLILGIHAEAVFWISSTGHILCAFFMLFALYMFILWRDKKRMWLLAASIVGVVLAPLFHEVGIVTGFMIILYDFAILQQGMHKKLAHRWTALVLLLPVPFYFIMRTVAKSHGLSGDYNYNFLKLPYNVFGNLLGYIGLSMVGTRFIPVYSQIRLYGREHVLVVALVCVLLVVSLFLLYKYGFRRLKNESKYVVYASLLFFVMPLLPMVAFGNIASRYTYLPAFGLVLFSVFLLRQLYVFICRYNRYVALAIVVILTSLFSIYSIKELYRVNEDWKKAGQITNKFLININYAFPTSKATPPNPVFYFVNVPIRNGEAWVFPVGLPDALWFTFQNDNLTVHTMKELDLALDAAEGSGSARVFEFDKEGNVDEVVRTKTVIPSK